MASLNPLAPSRAFHKYDSSHKGYLLQIEFRCALAYLHGVTPSEEETQVCWTYAKHKFEKENPKLDFKGISLSSFLTIAQMRGKDIEKKGDAITELFQIMDQNRKGFVTIEDWRNAVKSSVGPRMASRESLLLDLFFEIDSNRDGKVSLKDFQQLLHFQS